MTETENKDWAISKLIETADSRLLTKEILDMAMNSSRNLAQEPHASKIFTDEMFREIAYKYGHVTKKFKIDLDNTYALATQKAVAGTLTIVDIQKLSAMAYFGNCSHR